MHWDLLWCARELFPSGTPPQCSVDIYTLGLVPSHCQVYVCLGAALWADRRDKFNILGFSVTLATKARISVLSLYQASPVFAFSVVVKTGCVPCTWQNVVGDSCGIQAGRVSKAAGDPGEGSLGCASVLSRCPTAHSADTLREAQHGQHTAEVTAAAREDLQAKSAGKICRQGHATMACHSVEPADRLLLFSAPWAPACCLQAGAFVLLTGQYLLKRTVREISSYLNFKPNESMNKRGLLQCNLDTRPWNGGAVSGAAVTAELCQLCCHCCGHSDPLESPVRGGSDCSGDTSVQVVRGAADTPPHSDGLTLHSISPVLFTTLSRAKSFWLWRKDIRKRTKSFVSCEHFSTLQGSKCCTDIYLNTETFWELTVKSVVRAICFSLLHRLVTFFAWLHILVLVPFTSLLWGYILFSHFIIWFWTLFIYTSLIIWFLVMYMCIYEIDLYSCASEM